MTRLVQANGHTAALFFAAMLVVSALVVLANEDPNAEFRRSFQKEWAWTIERVEGLAKAIPEETYDWRPAEGVRSVSEAVMHIAHGNFLFANALDVPRPDDLPEDLETITDKAEVMATLRRSFEQVDTAIEQALTGDLDRAEPNFGTVRAVLLRALVHANEHLGQLIAYGRTNGVAPPWSR
jgi:uncharacterized damage-inducible protein DinB